MTDTGLGEQDLAQIEAKGTTVARIETQLQQFQQGDCMNYDALPKQQFSFWPRVTPGTG